MDPVTLSTVTAALTVLGTECAKGIASKAGQDIWAKAKSLLGWTEEPPAANLPQAVATKLLDNEPLMGEIVNLLSHSNNEDSSVQIIGSLVQNLRAEKVVVAGKVDGGITF